MVNRKRELIKRGNHKNAPLNTKTMKKPNYTKRCLKVVNSCQTREQLRSAINYVMLAKCYHVELIKQAIEFKVLTLTR